ncbi:MAG TPA: hypothetical protein VG147_08840 [Solirubrobacteraceae bacterium]|nr:hypothetical protein [Solirubrobacteraceae bacterium]
MAGVESLEGTAHTSPPGRPAAAWASRLRRPRLDRFDIGLLGLLVALSAWTLGLDLWQVVVHGRIWTGTEAVYQEDGMQSMMWIEGILHHGASPDLYVLVHTPADFFQPLLGISAGVAALGVAPYVALLLWKPVAIVAIFFAVRAYVHRTVSGLWPRRAALTLALFFGWGAVIGDSWIVFWSWGYPFALIALACAIGALLAYARDRAAGRVGLLPALLGALASWLHPWQGETLLVILLGTELVLLARRERVAMAALALTVALTALPLGYFAALVHFDAVWQREREAALSTYPVWLVVKAFVLLVIPAALAYRVRAVSFLAVTARVWPFAVVAVFALSEWQGSGSTHALLGATVPLGVLAVEGVRTLPWHALAQRLPRPTVSLPALAVVAIAVLTIPGTIYMFKYAYRAVRPRQGNANFIAPGESAALSYLAHDPQPGGVLTRFYLGVIVPAQTGRQTYTGNCYWSEPYCRYRSVMAEELLAGKLSATRARSFVQSTGARFVLGDCRATNLTAALQPIASAVYRFRCATVYVIRR